MNSAAADLHTIPALSECYQLCRHDDANYSLNDHLANHEPQVQTQSEQS